VPVWLLQALDILFLLLHSGLILFNLLGWAWRRTRRWHLVTLAGTAASWFLMAPWYGIGYCVCTDWHWRIRAELGIRDPDRGYIQFLLRVLLNWQPDHLLVRNVTGLIFLACVVASVVLNLRDRAGRLAAEREEAHLARARRA
jgi:hypothetical protein